MSPISSHHNAEAQVNMKIGSWLFLLVQDISARGVNIFHIPMRVCTLAFLEGL